MISELLVKNKMKPALIKSFARMTFQAFDTDNSGDIDLKEFIGAFARVINEEKIKLTESD